MTGLVLTRIDTGDADAVHTAYDLRVAAAQADRPDDPALGWRLHEGLIRHPWPGYESQSFLGTASGRALGLVLLSLPVVENRDTATFGLEVHPAYRRQGVGRSMLADLTRQVAESGRTRLVTEAVLGSPGAEFATATGFRPVLHDTQRRLHLTGLDEPEMDRLLADARARSAGYSMLSWAGVTPAEHLAAVAALDSRMTTDAPMDDLAWEQEVFDLDRRRGTDAVMAARRNRAYTSVVRHDASGSVVGTTSLVVADGVDEAAGQWQTIVAPEHRGHRLGLLLKISNLRFMRAHEPAVTAIDTWNADSNAPMLAVNVAMGFRPLRQWAEWERKI